MTLGLGLSLRTILGSHGVINPVQVPLSHTTRPASSYYVLPSPMVMVAGYLLILLILVVFGVCMGWQDPGDGGNGGGGGPRRPRAQEPTPPGGRQLTADSPPQPVSVDDFEAWEAQLRGADDAAPDRRENVPVGGS